MKKNQNKSITWYVISSLKFIIPIFLFLLIAGIGIKLLGNDFKPFIKWWLTLFILGITFYPIAGIVFRKFHDGGWLFSKTIGLAISGWLLWFLSSMKLLQFTERNARISVAVCCVLNILILVVQWKRARKDSEKSLKSQYAITGNKIAAAMMSEVLFFLLFFIWCYMRGFKPEAYGTEKFMDYGFMTTMMRTEYMPPEDLWFSGNYINYYYVGQYMATYMTKLSGVLVGYGYNLMMMTLAAFGFVLPYSIVYNVTKVAIKDKSLKKRNTGKQKEERPVTYRAVFPSISGLITGTAVCFAGNMHYPIYKWIVPYLNRKKGVEIKPYWFPNATRYIGYNPETTDKTIHEFPMYSFVLGDLHAHVINIIFVLTVVALLFSFLQFRKDRMDSLRLGITINTSSIIKEVFQPIILLLGFFIGLFRTTNYWDFPIYFVVSGAIILFSNAVINQFKKRTILLTALHAVVILVIAELTALPFTLKFNQISSRICLTVARTPIYQLLVLWGLPIVLIAIYIINQWKDLKGEGYLTGIETVKVKEKIKSKKKQITSINESVSYDTEKNKLFQFIENLSIAELFITTIGLCGIGLILMPEIVYVQDIYSGDFKRANTMFKLTYQAFILFGLCMGYIIMRYLAYTRLWKRKLIAGIGVLFLFATVCYAENSTKAWFGKIFQPKNYKTLDASAFMEKESMDDYLATNWLNENIEGLPVVLEAQGDSYTFYQRVSVITGLPTVMGWKTHEWLWRSDETGAYPTVCEEREKDIEAIYNAVFEEDAKILLEKYNISYIYIGKLEREKYINMNETVLRNLGEVVYEVASQGEQSLATYIIKIRNN